MARAVSWAGPGSRAQAVGQSRRGSIFSWAAVPVGRRGQAGRCWPQMSSRGVHWPMLRAGPEYRHVYFRSQPGVPQVAASTSGTGRWSLYAAEPTSTTGPWSLQVATARSRTGPRSPQVATVSSRTGLWSPQVAAGDSENGLWSLHVAMANSEDGRWSPHMGVPGLGTGRRWQR